ncbi:MAG: pilus assembly protein TadG-related protein, partial [Gammaproteobacteria bacterium]
LALVAVGMLAIIGMAGLALQSGHLFVNKTHLQNALDAAALSAAKTLKDGGTVADATNAGRLVFKEHQTVGAGDDTFLQGELDDVDPETELTFEFSPTLVPFAPGATEASTHPATFVRAKVLAGGLSMDTWLANVLPGVGDEQSIGGTAVAGPAPVDDCPRGVMPLLMCAGAPDPGSDESDTECSDGPCYGFTDTDCSDGACYGFNPPPNGEVCLKNDAPSDSSGGGSGRAAGGGGGGGGGAPPSGGCTDFQNGTGNFHLLALGDRGGDAASENLAGGYSERVCVGDTVDTEPGVVTGPTFEGFNSRFGLGHMDPTEYPPDTVTHSEDYVVNEDGSVTCAFCYDDYEARQRSHNYNHLPIPDGDGVAERRRVPIPIGRCEEDEGGRTQVTVVGIGCFFLTRPTTHTGNTQEIYGQLIGDCEVDGDIATAPPGGALKYKIVLYKDPNSRDS